MNRSIPKCFGKPLNIDSQPNKIRRVYSIDVITPIFGGGVESSENDLVTLIRPSSIRGNLRSFWRMTRGAAKCISVAELRQSEGEIWGKTDNPSQVIVEVSTKSQGITYPCAHIPEGKNFAKFKENHPGYALFPFQGNKKEGTAIAECTSKVSFELKLIYPANLSADVDAAVWAWTNFGGASARARRGCGALYCHELSPPDASRIGSWYKDCLQKFGVVSQTRQWPILPNGLLVKSSNSAMQAWNDVVSLMQTFRQGQNVGRNPGTAPNRPKRSRWPEPETIRNVTAQRDPNHSRMDRIPNDAFPRAELGLPIVFHFKDHNDPKDTELYPIVNGQEMTRMASPIILRPIVCQNGEVQQMILCLKAHSPDEVVLKKASGSPRFKKIRDPMLSAYPQSPLGSPRPGQPARSPSGSAIEGFLAFAKENKFREV